MRAPRPFAAVLATLAVALVACTGGGGATTPAVSDDTIRAFELAGDWQWQRQSDRMELGVTHTQDSLDATEPAAARQRGFDILGDSAAVWQNNHLMGFGTLNPEPSPGDYEWDSLDRRMQLTEDTGGRTVLTVCCAPDWMKGGPDGATDWSRLEQAPDPEHFDDYARLAAAAVQRYPQVERVLVWNELKGFYRQDENRWDYEGYTELYNQVYAAVKQVRPEVQIGGPYVVMTSLDPGSPDSSEQLSGPWGVADQRALDVVEYWLANNAGADFIAVDGGTSTRQETRPTRPDEGAQKFADVNRWLRERTDLAIWWAEFYPDVPQGASAGPDQPASAVATLAAIAAYAESGTSVPLLWGPQGHSLAYAALWTDATTDGGGQPTPLTAAWRWLVPRLDAGAVEIGRTANRPLLAFRVPDRPQDGVVLVNLTGEEVDLGDGSESLPGWAVAVGGPQS